MFFEYWLDLQEDLRGYRTLDYYLFLLLNNKPFSYKIPSTHFWAITIILMNALRWKGIIFPNNQICTVQDAFNEMEDCYIEESPFFHRLKLKLLIFIDKTKRRFEK